MWSPGGRSRTGTHEPRVAVVLTRAARRCIANSAPGRVPVRESGDGSRSALNVAVSDTSGVQPPDVKYARSGDVAIAYQAVGSGAPDIVFMRHLAGDLLSTWEQPLLVRHVEGLAANGRVLLLDKRGTGLSTGCARCSRSKRRWTTSGPSWTTPAPSGPWCGPG